MGARVTRRSLVRAGLTFTVAVATAVGCTQVPGDPAATHAPAAPAPGAPWQLVLDGSAPLDPAAAVYDVDGDVEPAALAALREDNPDVYLMCYLSVGTWEEWRADAGDFPADVIGEPLPDWPGERYVDVRRIDALGPIWEARLDRCAQAGFDAVDPDNIDLYANDSGFQISEADAAEAMTWLADQAHQRGLAVGQKNAPELVDRLVSFVDFAVVEECLELDECTAYSAYADAGKPIFAVEYPTGDDAPTAIPAGWCERAAGLEVSLLVSSLALDAPGLRCED